MRHRNPRRHSPESSDMPGILMVNTQDKKRILSDVLSSLKNSSVVIAELYYRVQLQATTSTGHRFP